MSPDIARRLVTSLKYDVINGSQDEKAIFASQVREATSYINSQAAQIKALKEKLVVERSNKIYLGCQGACGQTVCAPSTHRIEALKQLAEELPEVDWE